MNESDEASFLPLLCLQLAAWLWASSFTCLCLSFLIFEKGVVFSTCKDDCEEFSVNLKLLSLIISLLSSMSLLVMVFGDLVNIPLEDNS